MKIKNFSEYMAAIAKRLAPLGDRVLVQRFVAPTKTKSGIFLPESAQKKQVVAKVLAVGPGSVNNAGVKITTNLKVGDNVLVPQYGGHEVDTENEEEQLHLFRFDDILAKVEE